MNEEVPKWRKPLKWTKNMLYEVEGLPECVWGRKWHLKFHLSWQIGTILFDGICKQRQTHELFHMSFASGLKGKCHWPTINLLKL